MLHLTQAPGAPDAGALPQEPFTDSCGSPQLDGNREKETKQSSAKHKKRYLRSPQSLSLEFSLYSEGTKKWRPRDKSSAL